MMKHFFKADAYHGQSKPEEMNLLTAPEHKDQCTIFILTFPANLFKVFFGCLATSW